MKWFILSFMSVLLLSCQGKASFGTDGDKQVSVPDTVLAYKYKESGKKKSANGDQQGAIDDYTKAIYFNPNMIQLIIIGAWLKLLLEIIMVQFLITIKPLKLIHN